jgi:hypothetical protein
VNDADHWIYFDGPEPESVRPLLDALREAETPRPTREHKARALADFLDTLDARLGGVTESRVVDIARGHAPAVVRAPVPLASTSDAIDLPAAVRMAMGKLPFTEVEATPTPTAGPAARRQDLARTKQIPVMRSHLGETLPLDDETLRTAVAAVPFAGSSGGLGIVPFPGLTVQRYVSLRADLATRPDLARETLRRYGVPSEASHRALDEHWREQLAARPALRAELEAAVTTYTTWLAGLMRMK